MAPSKRFLQPINLSNISLDPVSASSGDFYYNSASSTLRYFDGTEWKNVGEGAAGVTVSETAPENPVEGQGWFKSSTSELYFWDGSFWVEATSVVDNYLLFTVSASAPADPMEGTGWFDNTQGEFFIYDGTYWQQVTSVVQSIYGFTVGNTPPLEPVEGAGWFNNVEGEFYIYDGTYWQEVVRTVIVDLAQDPDPELGGNLDANGYGLDNVSYIDFDTSSSATITEGKVVWNSGEGTLTLGLLGGDVDLDIGQENVVLCYNGTASAMSKGQVVYITGAQGQKPSIALASAASEGSSSKTLGIVAESISPGGDGFVTTFGAVKGVNTNSFTEGASLWLSTTPGQLTQTPPQSPNHLVFVGYCLKQSSSAGRIFVEPQNGYEIEELHNVLITSASENDILIYNSASSLWTNENLATAVKRLDGAGSGIDADLLDGQHGSYYTQYSDTVAASAIGVSASYTNTAINNLIDGAPETLNTLNELAAALNDDENFAATTASVIGTKAPIDSPNLTGIPTAPTAASGTSTTQIATTEFVQTEIAAFDALPDQTGNDGKYLTTDGTTTSWETVDALPDQTGNEGKYLTTNGASASWVEIEQGGVTIQTDVALSNSWWLGV